MEKAIQRAIEGGYEPFKTIKMAELTCELVGENYHCNFKPLANGVLVRGFCGANIYKILFDPEFWKCLGNAEGWEESDNTTKRLYQKSGGNPDFMPVGLLKWLQRWHGLIDHVAKNGTPDEYFTKILKK